MVSTRRKVSFESRLEKLERDVDRLERWAERSRTGRRERNGRYAREAMECLQKFERLQDAIPIDDEGCRDIYQKVGECQRRCRQVCSELERLTRRATDSNTGPSDESVSGLRGEMYCDEFTMVEPLLGLCETISMDLVEDSDVRVGVSKGGCLLEKGTRDSFSKSVYFSFKIDTDEYLYTAWNREARWCGVRSNPITGSFEFWGLFADPLKTTDVEEMAEHIEEQVPEVRKRLDVLLELERVSGAGSYKVDDTTSYSQLAEQSHSGVIHAGGLGEKSIERLVERYGSPSNIVAYGVEGVYKGASTAYGNDPDCEGAYWQCVDAVRRFRKFVGSGDIECDSSIEELFEYPKTPTYLRYSGSHPHTEEIERE